MPHFEVPEVQVLHLPEPPKGPGQGYRNWWNRHGASLEYKRELWNALQAQGVEPMPGYLLRKLRWRVDAELRMWNLPDSIDNLHSRLKFPVDAIKARQSPQAELDWKPDEYEDQGWIFDDSEAWIQVGDVEAEISRTDAEDPTDLGPPHRGLTLRLELVHVYNGRGP